MTAKERLVAVAAHLTGAPTHPYDAAFTDVPLAPPDAILNLTSLYKADQDPNKINVGVGAYRGEDGKPWVLPVVRKAERLVIEDPTTDHEYLPVTGVPAFVDAALKLIYSPENPALREKRIAGCQTISGTGAVRLGAEILKRFYKAPVYISNPTWGNHRAIFTDAGMEVREYPYWNAKTRGLAFEEMLAAFRAAPNNSIILLHPCAHNPTGVDPTFEQWKQIAEVLKSKNHLPFFDCAYQGFATGDLDRDAQAVRYFVSQGFEMLTAQSFAKNFGLYGQRAGCISVVASNPQRAAAVLSQCAKISRGMYSTAPAHGARIAARVLNDPVLYQEWQSMANRIISMRVALFNALKDLNTPGTWNHIVDQIGMFSYTGLTPEQVQVMKEKFHIYMTDNGRISMAGLNTGNVRRFAEAVDWVVRNVK
ncbi:Aspartate aminotransferase, cytoplasmic [Borealophlyctis nickersoniae]|nr:Aspartate aminotransferase, cytoplasmic [Borealophlyctis nickersoniae]